MSELLRNSEFVWAIMAILIFAITFAFKYPYKKLTGKIKSETKRKIANKAIVIFAFLIGIGLNFAYCHYFGAVFTIQESLKYSLSAIAIHSAFEIRSKGKVENVFNTQEGNEIIEKASQFVEGTPNQTIEEAETPQAKPSAIDEFWNSVKK